MFNRKFAFQAFAVIILFIIVVTMLLLIQKPYGCDRQDTECLIAKGVKYNDFFICARALESNICYYELASGLNNSWPCNYISVDKGEYAKDKCFDTFS